MWFFASVVLVLAVLYPRFRRLALAFSLGVLIVGLLTFCAMGAAGAFR